jgi:hypothetical protein
MEDLEENAPARLTLPPRTEADRALRAELLAQPDQSLARLERAAREQPRGRWQRDACLPLAISSMYNDERSERLVFCLLYMPDALPAHGGIQTELRYRLDRERWRSSANPARLALVDAHDDATRALYRAGAAFDGRAPTWWENARAWRETPASMAHRREGSRGGGSQLVRCERSCCDYRHYGTLPCMGGAIVTTRVCFDDELRPTDAWFFQDNESDDLCVDDER